MANWTKGAKFSVTVCDKNGKIVEMNDAAAKTFETYGGAKLVDTSIYDCHPESAREKIAKMFEGEKTNIYTIGKKGVKKLIYQGPYFDNGEFAGIVELSIEIPEDMPHHSRD
jgi:hypothetical protein